jgi:hypothetical protein
MSLDEDVDTLRKEYDKIKVQSHKFKFTISTEFESENIEGLDSTVFFGMEYLDDIRSYDLMTSINDAKASAKSKHEKMLLDFDARLEVVAKKHDVDAGHLWDLVC